LAVELDRDNYESETANPDLPMIVDYWGPQCKPCLALMPHVDELEKTYEGKIKVGKVDVSKNRMLCAKQRVMGVPTFIIFKGGVEVERLTGDDVSKDDIKKAIEAVVD